jgi:hypothetical protein
LTFKTLEKKLLEWQEKTEQELLLILNSGTVDMIQHEEARSLEQELWLIERLRCRIFHPQNRPRQESDVTSLFMKMVLHELSAEFIRQERYGLCFFLKTRQADLIGMCTEERIAFSMAS